MLIIQRLSAPRVKRRSTSVTPRLRSEMFELCTSPTGPRTGASNKMFAVKTRMNKMSSRDSRKAKTLDRSAGFTQAARVALHTRVPNEFLCVVLISNRLDSPVCLNAHNCKGWCVIFKGSTTTRLCSLKTYRVYGDSEMSGVISSPQRSW